jgi:hypothetical protein
MKLGHYLTGKHNAGKSELWDVSGAHVGEMAGLGSPTI